LNGQIFSQAQPPDKSRKTGELIFRLIYGLLRTPYGGDILRALASTFLFSAECLN
jgi:hypothetical protein